MKEFVFSFIDKFGKKRVGRASGATKKEATDNLKQMEQGIKEVLAAFEVDDTLDKILSILHQVPTADLEEINKFEKDQATKDAALKKQQQDHAQKLSKMVQNAQTGELTQADWNTMLSVLTPQEKDELYNQLVEDAKRNWKDDKANLAKELQLIDHIFEKRKGWKNKTVSIRDIASQWGTSHVYVIKVQKKAEEKVIKEIGKKLNYPLKIKSFGDAMKLLMSDKMAKATKQI